MVAPLFVVYDGGGNKMDNYESLRLDNQVCFPLYACAKEVVRQYRKPLEKLGLTYTIYSDDGALGTWRHDRRRESIKG